MAELLSLNEEKRVTGRSSPIAMHLGTHVSEVPLKTSNSRRTAVRRFDEFAKCKLHKVDRKLVGRYVSHLIVQGYRQATINKHLSHLQSYWRWLERKGIVEVNPWQGQQTPPKDVLKRRIWEPDEVVGLIKASPNIGLADAIAIAALTGARASEIAGLKFKDCQEGKFHFARGGGKTESAERLVPVHSQLTAILERRLTRQSSDELLLPEFKGKGRHLSDQFAALRNTLFGKAEEGQHERVLHSIRHSFITERINAGVTPVLVSQLVGQKFPGITLSVYFAGSPWEQKVEAVEAVSLRLG